MAISTDNPARPYKIGEPGSPQLLVFCIGHCPGNLTLHRKGLPASAQESNHAEGWVWRKRTGLGQRIARIRTTHCIVVLDQCLGTMPS